MTKLPPYRVLVFPGGTEIRLEVQRNHAYLKEVELVGAGSTDTRGRFAYRSTPKVRSVARLGWLEVLNEMIDELVIDFVYPEHDETTGRSLIQIHHRMVATMSSPTADRP